MVSAHGLDLQCPESISLTGVSAFTDRGGGKGSYIHTNPQALAPLYADFRGVPGHQPKNDVREMRPGELIEPLLPGDTLKIRNHEEEGHARRQIVIRCHRTREKVHKSI